MLLYVDAMKTRGTRECRKMAIPFSICLICCLCGSGPQSPDSIQENTEAVTYNDVVYLSLNKLAECLEGKASLNHSARGVHFSARGKRWEFANGGDRLHLPTGTVQLLKHPILVLKGKHFFPLDECAEAFGYAVERQPRLVLVMGGKKVALESQPIGSTYRGHKVDDIHVVHEFVTVKETLHGMQSLHRQGDVRELQKETVLLVRRAVVVDGVSHLIVTDCGPNLQSCLVIETELRQKTISDHSGRTPWERYRKWFANEALSGSALQHGDRRLSRNVCLTIDLCWSLRRYEDALFTSLNQLASKASSPIHPVLFVSGRWLEQHPLEMHNLIRLSHEPRMSVLWGLHSWDHPKSKGFMNDYPPEKLRSDTLRLERALLEWGIVPTVYYRFPGLIHDSIRLREILDLDLLPIDCDSWLALVEQRNAAPFCLSPVGGSILLVHGNGNEPAGISALGRWLEAHREWEFGPLSQFLAEQK